MEDNVNSNFSLVELVSDITTTMKYNDKEISTTLCK
jgi:hypothetical protein